LRVIVPETGRLLPDTTPSTADPFVAFVVIAYVEVPDVTLMVGTVLLVAGVLKVPVKLAPEPPGMNEYVLPPLGRIVIGVVVEAAPEKVAVSVAAVPGLVLRVTFVPGLLVPAVRLMVVFDAGAVVPAVPRSTCLPAFVVSTRLFVELPVVGTVSDVL